MTLAVQDKNPWDIGRVYLANKYGAERHSNALQGGMAVNPYTVGVKHPDRPKSSGLDRRKCVHAGRQAKRKKKSSMVAGLKEQVTMNYASLI